MFNWAILGWILSGSLIVSVNFWLVDDEAAARTKLSGRASRGRAISRGVSPSDGGALSVGATAGHGGVAVDGK